MGNKEKKLLKKRERRWKRTLIANKELCRAIGFKLGFWWRFLEYLTPPEQASLQLMGRYSYNIGVARAMKPFPVNSLFFPAGNQKLRMRGFSNKVNVLEAGINSNGWNSVRVGANIFQVKNDHSSMRLLGNTGSSRFRVISKAPMNQARKFASFCNLADQFIFAMGGRSSDFGELKSVERYDIIRDIWEDMPQMNVARSCHGSCTVSTTVFVICGYNFTDRLLNSIVKLETLDLQVGWQLIQMPPTSLLTPREWPVVALLNQNEILIMGGDDGEYLADTLTFDTSTNSVKVVGQEAPFKFSGWDGGCTQVRRGTIFSQVWTSDDKVVMIAYKNGSIQILYTE